MSWLNLLLGSRLSSGFSYFTLFLLLPTLSFARFPDTLWTKTYGGEQGEEARSVQLTSDGGYIIAGATGSFGAGWSDVWLIKTDSLGDTLWTKIFGELHAEASYSIQKTFDKGYVIIGLKEFYDGPFPDHEVYLLKTDSLGDTLWTKTYGGTSYDWGLSVCQTSDSGYVLTGATESFGSGDADVYIVKTNKKGDTLWTRTFGGSNFDVGNSIVAAPDGGYVIAGVSYSTTNGEGDVYIIKITENGNPLWIKIYGDTIHEWSGAIAVTNDSGYIITGQKEVSNPKTTRWPGKQRYSLDGQLLIPTQESNKDVLILKLDENGDTTWTKTYGCSEWDCGYSVQETFDNGYVIAGGINMYSGTDDSDVYILKTDSSGDSLWARIYGGINDDCSYEIQQTSDGYIVAGYTKSFGGGGGDVWLLKLALETGITEEKIEPPTKYHFGPTIFSGPLILPEDKNCKVFDITGRTVDANRLAPGVYFIEINDDISTKVIKVR